MDSFTEFLKIFVPKIQSKSKQVNQISWILETTGHQDAAYLKADLETEFRLYFNDKDTFKKLLAWDQELGLQDPLLKRELNVLIREFKPHQISSDLLKKIAEKEAHLSLLYSNFRPVVAERSLSDNDIREILKNENDVALRKETWEASKQIGKILAPHVIELVHLRNEGAKSLGFKNYFSEQLKLQEVDEEWLFAILEELATFSEPAYVKILEEFNDYAKKRFFVSKEDLGPWAWSDPFCQEDPLNMKELDELAKRDILESARSLFKGMGFDVEKILKRSDHFERQGKNQHAFCMHLDREGDVRILNNIQPTIKWLETVLHELGHAVYELGFSKDLPWLLKTPPHMITTEAIALLAGRQAYRARSLEKLAVNSRKALKGKAEESLRRKQLIFSRWVLVMTYFERELYSNPDQDLNRLWWELVLRFQRIHSSGSKSQCDFAAKYHISFSPVYYFSYLLGELFASTLEEKILEFALPETGAFLKEKVFMPGNSFPWNTLIEKATGSKISPKAWLKQFATIS